MREEQPVEQYILDSQVSEQREEYLTDQLVAFNLAQTTAYPIEPREPLPLHLFAFDKTGTLRGGLIGRTHAIPQWLEVTIVWINESARRHGLGRRLMEEAEREARQRGCYYARLATSNYQAPGFYQRLGYSLYGQLENCPPGETVYYFWKELGSTQLSANPDQQREYCDIT